MGNLDPSLMREFCGKVCDPRKFPRIYSILRSYRKNDLKSREGACHMIDRLSDCCSVTITAEQRENAAQWLMNCGVNPQDPDHQREMWNMIKSSRRRSWF
ncbi:hypothetical protein RAH41_11765 [Gottfriedia acidiceleris]|uniref:hypothetical protein n=1 Tax=Gottfriedia acidiceleris TaxID=371036 RepID=UPI002F260D51